MAKTIDQPRLFDDTNVVSLKDGTPFLSEENQALLAQKIDNMLTLFRSVEEGGAIRLVIQERGGKRHALLPFPISEFRVDIEKGQVVVYRMRDGEEVSQIGVFPIDNVREYGILSALEVIEIAKNREALGIALGKREDIEKKTTQSARAVNKNGKLNKKEAEALERRRSAAHRYEQGIAREEERETEKERVDKKICSLLKISRSDLFDRKERLRPLNKALALYQANIDTHKIVIHFFKNRPQQEECTECFVKLIADHPTLLAPDEDLRPFYQTGFLLQPKNVTTESEPCFFSFDDIEKIIVEEVKKPHSIDNEEKSSSPSISRKDYLALQQNQSRDGLVRVLSIASPIPPQTERNKRLGRVTLQQEWDNSANDGFAF